MTLWVIKRFFDKNAEITLNRQRIIIMKKLLIKNSTLALVLLVFGNPATYAATVFDSLGGSATTEYTETSFDSVKDITYFKTTNSNGEEGVAGVAGESVTINSSNYIVDSLIANSSLANSGDTTEKQFIEDVLGVTPTSFDKQDASNFSVIEDSATGVSFIETGLTVTDGYFLLKFGDAGGSIVSHYLFKNLTSLSNLVWLTSVSAKEKKNGKGFNILGLSHLAFTSGTPVNTVPLPAAVWLFGSGFVGLIGISRKKKS